MRPNAHEDGEHHVGELIENFSRGNFFVFAALALGLIAALSVVSLWFLLLLVPVLPPVVMGLRDATQKRHSILRNFPLMGRFRYMLEALRPEIRQYFIEGDQEQVPISREMRSVVFQRAKGQRDTIPFGTRHDVNADDHEWVAHSLYPAEVNPDAAYFMVGEGRCKQPYRCSVLNISAMSYGSLSANAIRALSTGAGLGGFAHNTGEGGVSPYHLEGGGDLIWQIGTGYFGCRSAEGNFDAALFAETVAHAHIKMVELKLSQGAKPAHGGMLPGAKVTEEIAAIRRVPVGKDVNSPPGHSAFNSPESLLNFVCEMREASGGKPVGFKLCLGQVSEWHALVDAMKRTGNLPDFINVDGAEGGTGAAPLEFSNSVGMALRPALQQVHRSLSEAGLRDQLRVICAGKLTTGFHLLRAQALGADGCNSARAMMFALGCIQALKCNTNRCPTGVATTNPTLAYGLVVDDKAARVASFHRKTVHSYLELLATTGVSSPRELEAHHLQRGLGPLAA